MQINSGQYFFWVYADTAVDVLSLTLRYDSKYLFIENSHSGNYFILIKELKKNSDMYNTRLLLV